MMERCLDDPLDAAAYVFERWLPGWRLEFVTGQAPPAHVRAWESAPAPADVAEYGAFPATFGGPGGDRHPVGAEWFESEPADESFASYRAASGSPDEGAEQVVGLVLGALEAGTGPLGRRARTIAGYTAGEFAGDADDLLVIEVATEPGGPAVDGELHLLARGGRGRTLRLALAPATAPPDGDPLARAEAVTTLLGDTLWVNNNNPLGFAVTFDDHGLDLSGADPAAAFEAGWAGAGDWEVHEDGLRPLDDPRTTLVESERALVEMACAQALEQDAPEEIPGDQLVAWLVRELLHAAVEGLGAAPLLAYGAGLPPDLAGDGSCLLLVGPDRTVMIDVDDSC
ncbi:MULTISPECIES: hypothetical protein [Thermomonosporaceae]|uniref:hypothetical protein n=1 Tax=Thermomonosporaceae TaxID=2012 RepID=UPI00255A8610|nr:MULTISPECIES: hypothetical protein [Thermomonosporaceae]MDL4773092.1 hypothetical protein [Actinomadura xylanilytica]